MKRTGKLAIGAVLTTIAVFGALRTVSAPSNETAPSSSDSCSYIWAYKDAPDLTASFDGAVKALNQEAAGRVEFFGEDCVYADGSATFITKETDFYTRLKADDLSKEEEFGNWVAQVMEIVTQLPREELPGNYGFVEFTFEKSETERISFRVPIQQYINDAQGKRGAELLRLFYSPP